jgi:murein DD-endopeptidase MepM/ murein hydrolase activator NlpD
VTLRTVIRRILVLVAVVLALAANASGDVGHRKAAVDAKIARLQARIAAMRAHESALSAQVGSVTAQIRSLERRVGDVSQNLAALQQDLALRQRRLDKLNALYTFQTLRYGALRQEYRAAVQRLDERLVEIYKTDPPSTAEIVLQARSIDDLLNELSYFNAIAANDKRIATEVRIAREQVRVQRLRTIRVRAHVVGEMRSVVVRERQFVIARDELLASRHQLGTARLRKLHALQATRASEQEFVSEVDALNRVSAQLASRIQAAQSGSSAYTAHSSSSGFIWPVNGPITSPFGMRWGRMHQGIDIGVPYGTPIHAAAAGRIIYCGWESGYGNLTVIDHGNGLATAYGHQSSIEVHCGQDVAQGQVIGLVGATGDATGPHLHFEVRVNGTPVDPLGYL